MIYTAPYVMLFDGGKSITRASGKGLGPGNQDFLGPVKRHQAIRRVLFGARKSQYSVYCILYSVVCVSYSVL